MGRAIKIKKYRLFLKKNGWILTKTGKNETRATFAKEIFLDNAQIFKGGLLFFGEHDRDEIAKKALSKAKSQFEIILQRKITNSEFDAWISDEKIVIKVVK